MKFIGILILTAAAALAQSSLLPDPQRTPGVANPDVTQENIHETICVKNWTDAVRPPVKYTNKLKVEQMKELGLAGKPRDYEEDHFRPLELGGAPRDPQNLSPQIWPLARQKDVVETWLHSQVCADKLTLDQAWQQLQQWPAIYEQLKGHPVTIPEPIPSPDTSREH